jgi:glycosyltransferase involved in cell wall biosynthesis/GT2 family glycosyltransferase
MSGGTRWGAGLPGRVLERFERRWGAQWVLSWLHRASRLRLVLNRRIGAVVGLGRRTRIVSTACWRFPIYSQTFVYQELTQLLKHGHDVKFLYSELERSDPLPDQFAPLWRGRRRMFLSDHGHEEDFQHYRRRMPDRVDRLVRVLCRVSGLSPEELMHRQHFRQSFSFARVVEAFRPHYLHSYFFYEGTLFTFVASYLLGIPRGVSCYSDHGLADYELKAVGLHLRHCALVVATSNRIMRELLEIAPGMDADRILVKPNAVNASRFPLVARGEPEAGQPYRLACVCRFDPKKGIVFLVRALKHLRDRGLDAEVHVAGTADPDHAASVEYARHVESEIHSLAVDRFVHLEGRRSESEVRTLLARSQLFVAPFVELPSGDKDGIPTTILEAMATGQAVVATDAGSITEVIRDGENGVIVPQRDPVALADAIAGLLADPPRRARLGSRAAETVRARYDVHACDHLFHDALRPILRSRPEALARQQGAFDAWLDETCLSMGLGAASPATIKPETDAAPREGLPESMIIVPEARNPIRLPVSTVEALMRRPVRAVAAPAGSADREGVGAASIVVVAVDNLIFNRMCLESVLANTCWPSYEIIFVDNGSTDGTREYVSQLAAVNPGVRLIFNSRNVGFSPAVNQGLRLAKGEVLVILNNDTIVPQDWLHPLLRHLDDRGAGLVGPVTNRTGNEAQIDAPYRTYGEFLAFSRAHREAHAGKAFHIRTLAMFCTAMRRDTYAEIGGLDERFEVGLFEDDDYAVRVRAAGYAVRCAEDAFVHHFGQASFGQMASTGGYGSLFHANRRRWEEKWERPWQPYQHRRNPAYEELLATIRTVVRQQVPSGTTVAVVSKGDGALLELAGQKVWHFPQDEEGQYTGYYPATSADAIAMLERMRSKGAQYFVLPSTAMWWLDHYGVFAEYVRTRFHVVADDPSSCLIVKLEEAAAEAPLRAVSPRRSPKAQ